MYIDAASLSRVHACVRAYGVHMRHGGRVLCCVSISIGLVVMKDPSTLASRSQPGMTRSARPEG